MPSTIYTTFIEREGCFIKVWAQQDKNVPLYIENALMQMKAQFDSGIGMISFDVLSPGLLCCAKFKDNAYYRARITDVTAKHQGMVEVLFIDYGNRDLILASNIRAISHLPATLISTPAQAKDFILAEIQITGVFNEPSFGIICNELRYMDFEVQYIAQCGPYILMSLFLKGQNVIESFTARNLALPIALQMQLMVLQSLISLPLQQLPPEMAQQRSPPMMPPPQQQQQPPIQQPSFLTFKSLPLKVGSEHTVFVSYVTDGPCFFSIQLQNKETELQDLMLELNNMPLMHIEETILPGCVCLCRSSEDDYICRGVVTNMVEESFKVFYVDFGNTEIRSYEHIYQIPFKYVIPKVMATRFALNGLQGSVVSVDMKIAFKGFVDNKPLRMRVASPSPKTGVSLCDLWDENGVSALDYVRCASLQAYPDPVPLTRGFNQDVKISFVFSCDKFFVQLRKKEEELNQMMTLLQSAAMQPISEDFLKVNSPCIALYAADGMHYRAQIISVDGGSVLVRYVDYGNEENIPMNDIRAPMMDFIMNLRPQAIECCLNGYQNMPRQEERDDLLEEIILEQYFTMKVVDVQEGRILVDLFDAQSNNVALLLFEKLAKSRPPMSPASAPQETRTFNNKYSPRENKTERQPVPSSNNWRSNKSPLDRENASFDREGNESPRRSNWDQGGNRFGNKSNTWDDGNKFGNNKRDSWPDGNRQRDVFTDGNRQREGFTDGNRQREGFTDGNRPRESFSDGNRQREGFTDGNRQRAVSTDGNRREGFVNGNRRDAILDGNRHSSRGNDNDPWAGGDTRRRETTDDKERHKHENSWGDGNHRQERMEFKRRSPREESYKHDRRVRRDNRSEDGSEKSFGSGKSFKGKQRADGFGHSPPKKQPPPVEEFVNYADLSTPFTHQPLIGSTHEVVISWFYNPTHFYCQLKTNQSQFDAMMKDIQYAYKKRKPLDAVEIGNYVIALFPEDRALYRAIVLESLPGGSFKVLYVDFGNSAVSNRIFKVEKRFTELPVQAVQCSMGNVLPADTNWPKTEAFSKYFDREPMNCQFLEVYESNYIVELTSNKASIKEDLKNAGLIVVNNPYEHFDPSFLLSQQIYSRLNEVNALDDFKLEILPGLLVSCAIYQHDKATQPNLDLLRTFCHQMVVAYIDDVQESRLFATLYDTKGKFIPSIELQEEMFDMVNPISPAIIIGSQLSGYVSHATATSFFIQPSYTSSSVESLLEQLFAVYDTTEGDDSLEMKEIVYAVKSEDGNWYRGLVKNIATDGTATVQYIDYGNEETIGKTQLRILREDFFLSQLAIEITIDQAESYLDQEISVLVNFQEDTWIGQVQKNKGAETKTVCEQETLQIERPECTSHIKEPSEVALKTDIDVAPQTPTIGFSVQLSHLDNPGQFYLQQSAALDAIDELQAALQPQISSLSDIENISTGIICAAPYSADQVWYRAQVLDADSDITTVRFIDYGNTDVLGTDIKIKTLPVELLSLEEHAKRCSLHLSPLNNEWTTEACKKFEKLTTDAINLTAEIVHQDEKTTFVRLYVDGICINDIFIKENYAVELQVETSQSFTGYVSHLNSPSEFWIQFEHACTDLEWIADQLTNAEKFKLLEDQAPGTLCAAVFPEDDSWYRARILSNTVAGVEVFFIDYGNSCTCTSLRELPEDLVMVPPLGHKCSLLKPQGLLEWPVGAVDKFKEISADGVTVFTVIKHSQGETNQVQLLFNDEEVSAILLQSVQLFDAVITHCVGLAEFALRPLNLNEKYVEVQSKIQELTEKPEAEEVVVAVLYENVWHRAKILGCIVDKYVVELIDIGMEVDAMELRQLPQELVQQDALVRKVKMVPVAGYAWGDDVESIFKALFVKGETVFQVELVNERVVRLFLNGCDVREHIPAVKCTPAASVQSSPKKVLAVPVPVSSIDVNEEEESAEDESEIIYAVEEACEVEENSQESITEIEVNEAACIITEGGLSMKCDTIIEQVQQIMNEISNTIVDNATQEEIKPENVVNDEQAVESQITIAQESEVVNIHLEKFYEVEVSEPEVDTIKVIHPEMSQNTVEITELPTITEDSITIPDFHSSIKTNSDINTKTDFVTLTTPECHSPIEANSEIDTTAESVIIATPEDTESKDVIKMQINDTEIITSSDDGEDYDTKLLKDADNIAAIVTELTDKVMKECKLLEETVKSKENGNVALKEIDEGF